METAYDLKDLGNRLKAKGLVQGEELALDVYQEVKHWLRDSATLSNNPYDNLVAPFLDQLDKVVLPVLDKISDEVTTKA